VRAIDRAVLQQPVQVVGRGELSGVGARLMQARLEGMIGAAQPVDRQCGSDVGSARDALGAD
jgi:hypothetical protein